MKFVDLNPAAASTSFRIAHLSDTHVSPEYHRRNIHKLKRLLAYVVDSGFDHVVITGDITANGEPRDYSSVRRLLRHFDLLNYDRLSVTIGNHDIFGGVHRAEDLLSFGSRCRTVDYDGKLQMFERAFMETFPKKAFRSESLFPFVKIIGPVALVSVNSVAPYHFAANPAGSNGRVAGDQLEETERILSHPSIAAMHKVVLMHHHFNRYRPHSDSIASALYHKFESATLKLRGRKDVEAIFRRTKVEAVLHGHTHVEGIYSRSGIAFSSTALESSRGMDEEERTDEDRRLRFNEFTIGENGQVHLGIRRTDGTSERRLSKMPEIISIER